MNKLKLYPSLSLISLVSCVIIGAVWTLFLLDVVHPLLLKLVIKLDNSNGIFIHSSVYASVFFVLTAIVVSLIYIAAEKIGGKLKISRGDFLKGFGAIPLAISILVFSFGLYAQSLSIVIIAFMCAVAYTFILLFCGARYLIGKFLGKPDKTPCHTE